MARIKKLIDGYVRINLRDAGDFGSILIGGRRRDEGEFRRDLEHLAAQARLRLSKFEDERGDVLVEYEHEIVCEHCGSSWTEDDASYNGGCCQADEANAPDDPDRDENWFEASDMEARG